MITTSNKKNPTRYEWEVIKRLNRKEDGNETPHKKYPGLVKVSILSNTMESHIDHRLASIMFHNIAEIHKDLKHQDNLQS